MPTPEDRRALWKLAHAAIVEAICGTPLAAMSDREWSIAGIVERYAEELAKDDQKGQS